MGQTTSHRHTHSSSLNNNNNNSKEEQHESVVNAGNTSGFSNRRAFGRKSTSSKQYSALVQQPTINKDELSLLRDSLLRNGNIMPKNTNDPPLRPVTISELKTQALADICLDEQGVIIPDSTSTCNLMSHTLPVSCTAKGEEQAASVISNKNRNEFYIVGDGYHKTEYCYYKSPNGNFHKLPTDSFHKMSEGCFVRMPDGVFRRLEIRKTQQQISRRASKHEEISCAEINEMGTGANNVKKQLLRFLKRSKSHTPATISKIQKDKDESRSERKQRLSNALRQKAEAKTAAGVKLCTPSNKIVVTMIENGGLPIVATSKADRPKCRESASVAAEKACTSRVCTDRGNQGYLFLSKNNSYRGIFV